MKPINAVIIDDEPLARDLIQNYLLDFPTINVLTQCGDGFQGLKAIQELSPDLIFLDIQMPKITGFELLELLDDPKPIIIFTTAYDEYALKAFEVNSIDYLLKPIDVAKLAKSLQKLRQRQTLEEPANLYGQLNTLIRAMQGGQKTYKNRFLVKLGDKLFPVPIENIRYFIAEDKLVFLITDQGKKFPVDFTLDELDDLLDPAIFFRLNRQYTSHIQSIEKAALHLNGKLRVFLNHVSPQEEIYVSREKAALFKDWLGNG